MPKTQMPSRPGHRLLFSVTRKPSQTAHAVRSFWVENRNQCGLKEKLKKI
jgi:hypothetical protein